MVSVGKAATLAVFLGGLLAPPVASAAPGSVSVGFTGTHTSRMSFVDVTAAQALNVTGFGMNLVAGATTISVYTKTGATTMGDTTNAAAWTLQGNVNVTGVGLGSSTSVPITPIPVAPGQTVAFALAAAADETVGNLGSAEGGGDAATTSASNAAISILSAYEAHGLFGGSYQGWPYQGTVLYDTAGDAPIPTLSQWGLIGLSLLLAAAGVLKMRQLAPG